MADKMVYTVEVHDAKGVRRQTYEGFRSASHCGICPERAQFLGMVHVKDSVDLWWLEDRDEAVEELQRYYRSEHGRPMTIRLFKPV